MSGPWSRREADRTQTGVYCVGSDNGCIDKLISSESDSGDASGIRIGVGRVLEFAVPLREQTGTIRFMIVVSRDTHSIAQIGPIATAIPGPNFGAMQWNA